MGMNLGINLDGARRVLSAVPNPDEIITSTSDFAWWHVGETPAFQDTGKATPASADGDAVRVMATGTNSLASFDREAPSDAARPVLATRDGRQVLRYDGVDDRLDRAFTWDGPKTFMMVGYNDPGITQYMLNSTSSTNTTRQHVQIRNDELLIAYGQAGGGHISETPSVPGGAFCILVEFNGDKSEVSLNGMGPFVSGSPGANTVSGGFRSGANNLLSDYSVYDEIAAVVIDGTLTYAEQRALIDWGMSKAALSYPTITRTLDTYTPSLKDIRMIAASNAGQSDVQMPCYWGSFWDVIDDTDFDGVVDGDGQRVSHLKYSSTDHAVADIGGIYLQLCFGDPVNGNWVRYDTALAAGYLNAYTGTKPASTAGLIFDYRAECETPHVEKVGSNWIMTFHPNNANGVDGDQRTLRASASSPFGPWTTTNAGTAEIFLEDGTGHTGYATWYPRPAQSTQTAAYIIQSLNGGVGGNGWATWGADANMENPTQISTGQPYQPAGVTVPAGEFNAGAQVNFRVNETSTPVYNGTDFTVLVSSGDQAGGADYRYNGIYESRMPLALDGFTGTPTLALAPNDINSYMPHELNGFEVPAILRRPGGGNALAFFAQADGNQSQEFSFVMPLN